MKNTRTRLLFALLLSHFTLFLVVTDALGAVTPRNGKIVYQVEIGTDLEVFSANPDGSGVVNLTNNPGSDDITPRWSPDGRRIAFTSRRDGNLEIYVMNADGSNPTRLTNQISTDSGPQWSNDGTRIAFHTSRDGNFELGDECRWLGADQINKLAEPRFAAKLFTRRHKDCI